VRGEGADPPTVEPGDEVRPGGRGRAVRHDEPGQAAKLAGDGPGDEHFGDGVQAGGGVVEDKQAGRARVRKRPCQPESLNLAAGQRGAVERGVQLPGQAGEEGGGLGLPGGHADLRVVRSPGSEPDGVMGGVADEFRAFEGIYHRFAEGRLGELAQVGPVKEHPARVGIGESPGELRQGGLAGPGPADHGDRGARRNGEVEVAQYRLAAVAYRDAAQP
jgi:hypothetical protein